MRSFYETLGVNESANVDEIKSAYHDLLRRAHPDKSDNPQPETISLATLIWSTLRDPSRRELYDKWLREQRLRAARGTIVECIDIEGDDECDDLEEYCRCGDAFLLNPEELRQVVDVGVFECASCSLCLEVRRYPGK